MKRLFTSLTAAFLLWSAPSFSADIKTLELTDWMDWERAASAQISPDGKQIIFTRSRVNKMTDKFDSTLWIMNRDGSKLRQLTKKGGGAKWSPDGSRIAYRTSSGGKAQLFVRWMDAEGHTSQITHEQVNAGSFSWSPGGKQIAFIASVPMKPEWDIKLPAQPKGAKWTKHATVVETVIYRRDRRGPITGFNHLFVVSADGGTAKQITSGRYDVNGTPSWTPDGKTLVVDMNKQAEPLSNDFGDVYAVDIASGEQVKLTSTVGYWGGSAVSPDGKSVVFAGKVEDDQTYAADEIRLVGINGKGERTLSNKLYSGAGGLKWAGNSKSVYFSMGIEGDRHTFNISINGNVSQVTKGDEQIGFDSMSKNGLAAGVGTSPSKTRNVVTYSLRNGDYSYLTDLNGDILEGKKLGDVEEIWYDSSENTKVHGWIVTPPDFDKSKKYPLVLYIHGGPHGMYGTNFNFMFQEYAAKGYVVLYTNPRGSIGYGADFANAINNAYPGIRDYTDLMRGVDTILGRGYIDEKRMYSAGCSGGGVLTTWIVTQTDRFAGAAALCPVTNWISFSGQADIQHWMQQRFTTPWWEDSSAWVNHSPITHVGKVKTPTLLMTGVKDLRTPIEQAEEFYSALKQRGVETVLVRMEGEYHGTSSKPSNMLRTQLYLQKWFSEHVKK